MKRLLVVFGVLISLVVLSPGVSAASRNSWGNRDVSYYASSDKKLGFHRTLSGATWYYYEIPEDYDSSADATVAVPFNSDYREKVAIPVDTCKGYGGFWVLLRNEYKMTSDSEDGTIGELTGRPAVPVNLNEVSDSSSPATDFVVYKNPNDFPSTKTPYDSNGSISTSKRGTMDAVRQDYGSMLGKTAIPNGATWDEGNFSYFCYGELTPSAKNFDSFSTVSLSDSYTSAPVLNGTSYIGHREISSNVYSSIAVPAGSTVENITFKHYLAKQATEGDIVGLVGISSITRTINNGAPEEISLDENSSRLDVSEMNSRININSVDYYTASVTKSLNSVTIDSFYTVCETIVFEGAAYTTSSTTNNSVTTGNQTSSTACISITLIPSTGSAIVTSCEEGGGGQYMYKGNATGVAQDRFGNTVATVGVSVNGDLKTTTAGVRDSGIDEPGATVVSYAKPGDVIQFSYAICIGAATNDGGALRNSGDGTNGTRTTFQVHIGAGSTNEYNNQFLFGRAIDLVGRTIYTNNDKVRSMNLNADALYFESNIKDTLSSSQAYYADFIKDRSEILFASPDSRPKQSDSTEEENDFDSDYSCLLYDGLSNTAQGLGGYQVPGFQYPQPNCNSSVMEFEDTSSRRYSASSVVGASISQSLEYTATAIWPLRLMNSNGVIHDYCGGGTRWCNEAAGTGLAATGLWMVQTYKNAQDDYEQAYEDFNKNGFTLSPSGPTSYATASAVSLNKVYSSFLVNKTATVKVPYNFKTALSLEINDQQPTVEAGESISLSANVDILPRTNPLTSDKDESGNLVPYATITPEDTKVQIISLLISDQAKISGEDSIAGILNDGYIGEINSSDICNYYIDFLGSNLGRQACDADTVKGFKSEKPEVGNSEGNLSGEMGYYHDENIKLVVPDAEAGYKYCVAIGINHGDSHGFPDSDLSADPSAPNFGANQQSTNSMMTTDAPRNWSVSRFSCSTIVKKPSFQVWNGGVYSGGPISASISNKKPNAKLKNIVNEELDSKYFGSWAEYFIISKSSINNIASASGLGYASSYTWEWYQDKLENGKKVTGEDGKVKKELFRATGLQPLAWRGSTKFNGNDKYSIDAVASGLEASKVSSFCVLSHLSIANQSDKVNCKNWTAGKYTSGDADKAMVDGIKDKILNYYTSQDFAATLTGLDNNISYVDLESLPELNGAKYLKVDGNLNIDTPILRDSGTLVIHATGHIDIDKNICLGEGLCKEIADITDPTVYKDLNSLSNFDGFYGGDNLPSQANFAKEFYEKIYNLNNLSLEYRNSSSYTNLSNMPQVIIIAESISISGNVSQIDAWLITDSKNTSISGFSGGYVNTCKEFRDSETGTGSCWKTLKINGPVVTSALVLNRTGGAWAGLTGDVGSPIYDAIGLLYDYYYKKWENTADTYARNVGCGEFIDEKLCRINHLGQLKEEFLSYLGTSNDPTGAWRAYNAVGAYSSDKYSIASGRAYSRDLTCDGSITPAEIFDLHPIVYYWALAESQKSHQAVVTYAQEFAPRY